VSAVAFPRCARITFLIVSLTVAFGIRCAYAFCYCTHGINRIVFVSLVPPRPTARSVEWKMFPVIRRYLPKILVSVNHPLQVARRKGRSTAFIVDTPLKSCC